MCELRARGATERWSADVGRCLREENRALGYFLLDHPDVPAGPHQFAAYRALGRTVKYLSRHRHPLGKKVGVLLAATAQPLRRAALPRRRGHGDGRGPGNLRERTVGRVRSGPGPRSAFRRSRRAHLRGRREKGARCGYAQDQAAL